MFYKKNGFPEEGELVLCTVSKVMYNSVFADLDEYYNLTGMLHISEIAPGRIRNIRDYVVEGKVVVCVVLRIDRDRGHIDLSLRRVNDSQRRLKINEVKQEQKAEKIIELVAKENKIDVKPLYGRLKDIIFRKYQNMYDCFEDVALEELSLENLGVEKGVAEQLTELIKQRIKPPKVEIRGKMFLTTYECNGIDAIKNTLKKALSIGENKLTIKYLGGGAYSVYLTEETYKEGEKLLEKVIKAVEGAFGKERFRFQREKA